MGMLRRLVLLALVPVILLGLGHSRSERADALFHASVINQIMASTASYPGGSATVQYVEIRDISDLQDQVSHARLTAFNADGSIATVLKELDHNLASTATNNRTFLIASSSFAAAAGIMPDFTFATGTIPATGQICWGAPGILPPNPPAWDPANILNYVDCVAYNGYTGTGTAAVKFMPQTTLNPANGMMALFRHSETASNMADFVLQCPRPVNFAGSIGTFGPCTSPCPWDLSFPAKADDDVGFDDLLIFAKAYGSGPLDPNWNPKADFDGGGDVGFPDLLLFAKHYGMAPCP